MGATQTINRRGIAIVVALLAIAAAVVAIGSFFASRTSEATIDHGAATTAPAGSVVRDGSLSFQVKDMRRSGIAGNMANPYMQVRAQGEFIILTVAVQNDGTEPQSYLDQNQKLVDTGGRGYSATSAADLYLNSSAADINPGNSVQVVMAFDVPVNTVATALELHGSAGSEGARVMVDDPRAK